MSPWLVVLLVYCSLGIGFGVGMGFASAVQRRREADVQAAELALEQLKIRKAFQCAVAQMVPMRGYHDMPAAERMRQQLLTHMWTQHGGIVVALPKPSA